MIMSPQVCAVTVAYNNPDELTRLLSSLGCQDHSLSGLVIIDNSDKSYSAANREVFEFHSSRYTLSRYIKTDANVGSAGGFRRGMETAHEHGFDWVWLLDQDGAVSPDCLTELLKHSTEGDILCPNIVDIEQPSFNLPKAYVKNFFGDLYPVTWGSPNCQVRSFGTHAALISRKTLDTIGYYDDALFFVGWEDYDYGHRAVRAGLEIFFAPGALALHSIKRPNQRLKNAIEVGSSASRGRQKKIKCGEPVFGCPNGIAVTNQKRGSKIDKSRPRCLGYVTNLDIEERPWSSTKATSTFSQVYLESKRLEAWQFGIALAYSMCCALYYKISGQTGISLALTLRTYLKCFAYSLKKDWPYRSAEELRRGILK